MFAVISFTAAHFHLADLQHFSFSHRRYEIFMFFFQRKSSLLYLNTRSLSLSLPRECRHKKITSKKVDFSLKVRVAMRFPAKKSSSCLWCHTCQLSYFILICLWCGRSNGCTVTWLPKFLGFAISTIPIMHLICPPRLCISIVFNFWGGTAVIPRRNEKQRLCKILGDKSSALWEM